MKSAERPVDLDSWERSTLEDGQRRRTRILLGVLAFLAVITVVLVLIAETGVRPDRDPRVAASNPAGTYFFDGVYRNNPALWGIRDWAAVFQISSVGLAAVCWVPFVWLWWRRGIWHPGLTMMWGLWVAGTLPDPFVNWGYSAAFDPRVLHWPTDWPYVSLAPTVEPIVALAGYQYWWILPGLLGFVIWRRISRRSGPDSWTNRHPLLSLFLWGWGVGTVCDIVFEIICLMANIYVYTQFKGPRFFGGHSWQFPIIWGPLMQIFLYGFAAMFFWRDDRGRTVCGRIVSRSPLLRRRPRLGEVALVSAVFLVAYVGATSFWAVMKYNAPNAGRPWPFGEAKVYDPTGLWKDSGHPGPFNKGVLSTWPWAE